MNRRKYVKKLKMHLLTLIGLIFLFHPVYADDSLTGLTPLPTVPNLPSNLSAIAKSSTQIVISWNDTSVNETGFKIERKSGNCNSTSSWVEVIANKPANSTSQTFSNLSPNTSYSFRIRAYNAYGNSGYSNCAFATTGISGAPPAPSNLRATSASASKVNLTWTDNSTDETGFKIYRKAGSGSWQVLTNVNANTYSDTTAFNNHSSIGYQYNVRAYNAYGNSPATYAAVVPYRPINLFASLGATTGTVNLSWTDMSANEAGFEIYRRTGSCSSTSAWAKVATVSANTASWTDTNRTSGNTYSYKVRAYKKTGSMLSAYGFSLWSNCDDITVGSDYTITATKFGGHGSENGKFDLDPYGLALDGNGNVYVSETNGHLVHKFTPNGVFVKRWGITNEFYPYGLVVFKDRLYVCDDYDKVQVFDLDGLHKATWSVPDTNDRSGGMGVVDVDVDPDKNNDGNDNDPVFYVLDNIDRAVKKFNDAGTFLGSFQVDTVDKWNWGPLGIALNNGKVYTTDNANNKVNVWDEDGGYLFSWGQEGNESGEFYGPAGISVMGGKYIIAGDANLYPTFSRIQKFSLAGGYLAYIKPALGGFYPRSLAVNDAKGKIYICYDSSLEILIVDAF